MMKLSFFCQSRFIVAFFSDLIALCTVYLLGRSFYGLFFGPRMKMVLSEDSSKQLLRISPLELKVLTDVVRPVSQFCPELFQM
jgi:hypothetical protein